MNILHTTRITKEKALRNGVVLAAPVATAEDFYRAQKLSYPKFFKMDILCKWAWLGAEILMAENGRFIHEGLDKSKIAVVLFTHHGCLSVDKKYAHSTEDIPSPALFVYTLNNIMLGEICIRHGFKGEQACLVDDSFNSEELYFYVTDILKNRGMDACLCGWVDATDEQQDVCFFWVQKTGGGVPFSVAALQQVIS